MSGSQLYTHHDAAPLFLAPDNKFLLTSQTVQSEPNTFRCIIRPSVFITFLNSTTSVSQEVVLDEEIFF